jgi:peptidoglycan/xylan/chitin deacetylase (PgdA/CDA1 family)
MSDPFLQLLLHLPRTGRLSVLVFHRIMAEHDPLRPGEPTQEQFEARMRWIAANFEVLPLAAAARALAQQKLPKRALCLTFDDGYADNHELALPILQRLGLSASFFIATGYLDGGCMFNDAVIEALRQAQGPMLDLEALEMGRHSIETTEARRLAIGRILDRLKYFEPLRREETVRKLVAQIQARIPRNLMMRSEQVAALHRAGMQVGAHTVTHPILAEIPLEAARDEIVRGRARLEEITGAPVRVFAYPNGKPLRDYRAEHAALVRELGFEAAVSSAWGAAKAGDDLFQIPRFTPWDRPNWRFGLRLAKNQLSSAYARV